MRTASSFCKTLAGQIVIYTRDTYLCNIQNPKNHLIMSKIYPIGIQDFEKNT